MNEGHRMVRLGLDWMRSDRVSTTTTLASTERDTEAETQETGTQTCLIKKGVAITTTYVHAK